MFVIVQVEKGKHSYFSFFNGFFLNTMHVYIKHFPKIKSNYNFENTTIVYQTSLGV